MRASLRNVLRTGAVSRYLRTSTPFVGTSQSPSRMRGVTLAGVLLFSGISVASSVASCAPLFSATPDRTMKAVSLNVFGDPDVLYLKEQAVPKCGKEEVLVEVQATAINRADTLQRKGLYPPPRGASSTLGLECAGVVSQVGRGAKGFKVGDRVMCLLSGGGYAQYAAVPYQTCMHVPEAFSMTEAAAIPETWLTGYQLLHQIAGVKKGDYVLVHAGASGVGSAVIQMCNLVGAKAIVTVGSQEKLVHCAKLGAAFGSNYKEGPFEKDIKKFISKDSHGTKNTVDIVLDCVGASHGPQNINLLGMDSKWVVYGLMGGRTMESLNLGLILAKRIQMTGTTLRARTLDYKGALVEGFSKDVLPHFKGGAIHAVIDSVVPLKDVAKAHKRMEANLNKGKIVLDCTDASC